AHVDSAVEELLDRARGALHPGLPAVGTEELGSLDDRQVGVIEVGQRLGKEVRSGREVSVENDEELAAGIGERVPQVARLLVLAAIGADGGAEAKPDGLRLGLGVGSAVEALW